MMKLKVQVALNLRPQLLVPWDGFTLVSSELSQYLELDRLQSLPQESHGQAGVATSTSQCSIGTSLSHHTHENKNHRKVTAVVSSSSVPSVALASSEISE